MAIPLFSYVSFRVAMAVLSSFLMAFLVMPHWIQFMKDKRLGQILREEGPEHHQFKAGTPTMGGVVILVSMAFSTLLWAHFTEPLVLIFTLGSLGFGLIGFMDDWLMFRRGKNQGLSERQKMALLILLGGLLSWAMYSYWQKLEQPLVLVMPFVKDWQFEMNLPAFASLAILVLAATTNAVNFTDGLDGVAAGCSLITIAAYLALTYVAGHAVFSGYLYLPFVLGASEVVVAGAALFGGLLAFLWFNAHPAHIFMGDVGSLGLGGCNWSFGPLFHVKNCS